MSSRFFFWINFSWIKYCLGYAAVPVDLVPRLFFIGDMFMVVETDVVYERCRQMKTQRLKEVATSQR